MNKEIILLILLLVATLSGFLMGFGIRGMIESSLNKKVKGYISFWRRNDAVVSGDEQ